MEIKQLKKLIDVASGRVLADVVIKNCKVIDVYSGTIKNGDIALCDDLIAGVTPANSRRCVLWAALLGTVAGIGFIWMATQGVFDVFGDPIVGLPILLVAMVGVFGGNHMLYSPYRKR